MTLDQRLRKWIHELPEEAPRYFKTNSPERVLRMAWGASGLDNMGLGDFIDGLWRIGIRPTQVESQSAGLPESRLEPQFALTLELPSYSLGIDHDRN